jgi:flavin reductase (DIM6/NTAB) family NADH-FMN oxidoreductase RutF
MAIESRYPEQLALCIARDARGVDNPMTISWFIPASIHPPRIAVAIGKSRYTLEAIRHSRAFVLALLAEPQSDLARLCGTTSGRDADKFAELKVNTTPAPHVPGLLIDRAVAHFECTVFQEVDAGDHVIVLGEVVGSWVTDSPVNRMFTLVKSEHLDGIRQQPVEVPVT